jgi:hypothetical protein
MSSRLAISCCAARWRAAEAVNAASSLGFGVPAVSACGAAAEGGAMFASSASVLCQACSVTSNRTTRCCVDVLIAVSIRPSAQLKEIVTLLPFEPGWLLK